MEKVLKSAGWTIETCDFTWSRHEHGGFKITNCVLTSWFRNPKWWFHNHLWGYHWIWWGMMRISWDTSSTHDDFGKARPDSRPRKTPWGHGNGSFVITEKHPGPRPMFTLFANCSSLPQGSWMCITLRTWFIIHIEPTFHPLYRIGDIPSI